MRERNQGADTGGTRGVDAFIAQEKGERAANEADGDDGIGRDEKAKEPWTLVWLGWELTSNRPGFSRLHDA